MKAFCALIIMGLIIAPYLIIWWLTGFNLGQESGKLGYSHMKQQKTPGFYVWNYWVVLWVAYGQLCSLGVMSIDPGYRGGRYIVKPYIILGVLISSYGFACIIKLMVNDRTCTLA